MTAGSSAALPTVFFDLDGTLTNPETGITRCIRYALDRLGVPLPPETDLRWCIGPPLLASFETLLQGRADAGEALRYYRERFSETGLFENAVYDGIPDLLDGLTTGGYRLYLATSKPHVYAVRILDHFGLDGYFTAMFGSELDGTRTDKAELLAHALQTAGEQAADSVMVGDRKHDVAGAQANGMGFIGVLYGFGGREELTAAGATHLAETPQQVAELLASGVT